MSSPFEQLFDISPFPAVVSRLRDNSVIAINKRNSEMFGISHADAVGQTTTDYYANLAHRERLRGPLETTGRADDVLLHLKQPNGGTFWARASARLVTWDNEPAVLTVFDDISEQLNAQRALEESEQRLAAQSRALTALTARHADPNDTFEHRLRGILEMAAATLQVERVSMWRFDAGRAAHRLRRPVSPQREARTSPARGWRASGPGVFRRHRTRAGDRRAGCADRSADARVPRRRISSRTTSARCSTCRCAAATR